MLTTRPRSVMLWACRHSNGYNFFDRYQKKIYVSDKISDALDANIYTLSLCFSPHEPYEILKKRQPEILVAYLHGSEANSTSRLLLLLLLLSKNNYKSLRNYRLFFSLSHEVISDSSPWVIINQDIFMHIFAHLLTCSLI